MQVIADADRIARSSAEPVVCNGEACSFRYVTPAEGKPVDLLLVAVKATVLEPVSYTHLDVYKRQTRSIAVSSTRGCKDSPFSL